MSLHSMHRVASSAKQRTAASLRSVFYRHGYSKSSPTPLVDLSIVDGESSVSAARQLASTDEVLSTTSHGNLPSINSFDGDTSDEEGYLTANDECKDFEDRDSDDRNLGSDDDRRIENGVKGAFSKSSGHGLQLHSESRGNQTQGEGRPISQSQPINELRDTVVDLESEERLKQVDDATLLRFLKARNMDVTKAADMFIKDWRWRNQFAPRGYISEDLVPHQLEAEKTFLQGIDKKGRPLMIILGSKHFSKGRDIEEFKRYCFYCIEKVIANIPEGKELFATIFDAGNTAYRNMDTSATIMMVDLLQAHYPERMGQLFLIHASPLFNRAYRLIEPAIDVKTRKKIIILSDADTNSFLKEEIGEECLPRDYGGKAEFIPIQYARIDQGSFPCNAVSTQ